MAMQARGRKLVSASTQARGHGDGLGRGGGGAAERDQGGRRQGQDEDAEPVQRRLLPHRCLLPQVRAAGGVWGGAAAGNRAGESFRIAVGLRLR